MLPSVEESLESLFASASFLDSLPFQAAKGRIADTALAPAEVFEGTYIRDAEEHELGLFSAEESTSYDGLQGAVGGSSSIDHQSIHERDDRSRHRRSLLGRSTGGSSTSRNQQLGNNGSTSSRNAWNFPKSKGPARIGAPEKATPLKKRRAQNAQNKTVTDPEAYLIAARKLLQTYPMQRASEHVELLYSQYEGLMDAIADLEETLHQPAPKASTSAVTLEASVEDDLASLEAEIKREELEILALKEARKELDREVKEINGKSRKSDPPRQDSRLSSTQPSSRGTSMPSLKDVNRPTRQPPVPTAATTAASSKRMPSVVARRMAEQKEAAAAAARSRSTKAPSPPSTVSSVQKETSNHRLPEVKVQSPSSSSIIPPEEAEDEDQNVVISKDSSERVSIRVGEAENVRTSDATPPKRQLRPRVPQEQLDRILTRLISALPGNAKRNLTRDAESVLSALENIISQAETRISSPTSNVSTNVSVTGSPTSSTALTPVNMIEMHLLRTFLSLLVSLELDASTNSKEKLNLILRKPISTSFITSSNDGISSSTKSSAAGQQEVCLNMNNLKIYLGNKAKEKGLNEDLGHKAIYGLAAKKIIKIDRTGREAVIYFL